MYPSFQLFSSRDPLLQFHYYHICDQWKYSFSFSSYSPTFTTLCIYTISVLRRRAIGTTSIYSDRIVWLGLWWWKVMCPRTKDWVMYTNTSLMNGWHSQQWATENWELGPFLKEIIWLWLWIFCRKSSDLMFKIRLGIFVSNNTAMQIESQGIQSAWLYHYVNAPENNFGQLNRDYVVELAWQQYRLLYVMWDL